MDKVPNFKIKIPTQYNTIFMVFTFDYYFSSASRVKFCFFEFTVTQIKNDQVLYNINSNFLF